MDPPSAVPSGGEVVLVHSTGTKATVYTVHPQRAGAAHVPVHSETVIVMDLFLIIKG
jgi:hypothetical protein